jgi:hypothetical protein
MITLKVTSGPSTGHSLELEAELVLGREHAGLTIPDPEISRRHAVLRPVEGGVEVEDLGSMNGTFVDGERIRGVTTLTSPAVVRVGTSKILVEVPIAVGESTKPSPIPDIPGPDVTAPRAIPSEPPTRPPAAPPPIDEPDSPAPWEVPAAPEPIDDRPPPDVTAPRRIPQPPPEEPQPIDERPPPDVTAPRRIPRRPEGDEGVDKHPTAPRRARRSPRDVEATKPIDERSPLDVTAPREVVEQPPAAGKPDKGGLRPVAVGIAVGIILLVVFILLLLA